jgi:hypothetical protein
MKESTACLLESLPVKELLQPLKYGLNATMPLKSEKH